MKLYDALMNSLFIDENDMDKQLEDPPTKKKRRQDDQDQDPSTDSTKIRRREIKRIPNLLRKLKINCPLLRKAHKEPTVDDALEWTWFNKMVNAEKNQRKFDDVISLVIDFTNFTKNCLKKDKIKKADLEGPTFKLMNARHKNYIDLEYNFEQCYLALSDELDWVNPEGDRIPHDLGNPLPLHSAPGTFKDGDGNTLYQQSVKASANSVIIFFFTSAQDGNKLLDDERLSLADDLKKAHDQNQNKSK
ncbi:hypothetical protein Tco_0337528 [Tanacetum coccineum]